MLFSLQGGSTRNPHEWAGLSIGNSNIIWIFGTSSRQCSSVCKHNNRDVWTNVFRPKNSYFPERWQNIISLDDTLRWRVFVPIWSKCTASASGIISDDLSWDGIILRKMREWWWIIYARFQRHVAIQNIPNMPCGLGSPQYGSQSCVGWIFFTSSVIYRSYMKPKPYVYIVLSIHRGKWESQHIAHTGSVTNKIFARKVTVLHVYVTWEATRVGDFQLNALYREWCIRLWIHFVANRSIIKYSSK